LELKEKAKQLGIPIRFWIPFADSYPTNRPALAALLKKLGLTPRRSGVRWAAYQALLVESTEILFPEIRIPSPPSYSRDAAYSRSEESSGEKVRPDSETFGPADDVNNLDAVYEVLSRRYHSGRHDLAAHHDEHLP
jgi:hypothetical protein